MRISGKARKIIVNADDFGMSTEANRAIVEALDKNVISSTTLMTNMPCFDEACELAYRHRLQGKIGVHLNLTSGYPLSDPIRQCSRFCDRSGMFLKRRTRWWLSKKERIAVDTELEAQVKACLDRGLCPTHLDSHHHVHTEWPIGTRVIAVAHRYGIKAVRLSRNCGPGIDLIRKFYKWAYNTRLKMHGLAKTQYFGSAGDVGDILETSSGDIEMMVHLTSEDPENTADCSETIGHERWFRTHQLASYSCLA